jgi:tetratricopeptide (TPR) repeat protein
VKRALFVMVLLVATTVGGALAYQAASRDREYRALLSRGDAALRDDQTFGAIEAYSGAIAWRPDSMLAHLRRAETYQRRGDLEAAARDFRKAARLDPAATRPLEELGDLLYQLQRFTNAADAYAGCLRLDDRSPRVNYKMALARYREGRIDGEDGALAALGRAVSLNDHTPDAYYLIGLCLREQRRLPDAQHAIEKAVALSPGLIPAREELADLYGTLGRRADELEQLQVIAALDRDHVQRQVAVGLAHARGGHPDLAVLTLGNALERTPDPLIYGALGQVWLDMASTRSDALRKAMEALERAATGTEATSETLTLYGRALLQDGQLELAERTLQHATERYPIEPTSLVFYATAAERQQHLENARQALMQYVALAGDNAEYVSHAMRIATLSLRVNDVATAIDWLQKSAAASPNDVRILTSLAEAQVRYGDYIAARATVAKGLEKDPGSAALLALSRRLRN